MKHENKKALKFIAIFLLVLVIFPGMSTTFGAINTDYKPATVTSSLNVGGNESGNLITRAVFWLINTIGSIGEYLLTSFATVLSSAAVQTNNANVKDGKYENETTAVMPWADAIVYNAVPALDVNFINPDKSSFSNVMSGIISKMYYTIFSISITFFGIAVLIMAIRLATTAIAAEKARYKESITNFVISLILIFSMHYFMSFVFYLNESLVKVAFNVAKVSLDGEMVKLSSNNTELQKSIVEKVSDGSTYTNWFKGNDTDAQYQMLENYISVKLFSDDEYTKAAAYLGREVPGFMTDNDGDGLQSADPVSKSVMLLCLADIVVHKESFSSNELSKVYGEPGLYGSVVGNELYNKVQMAYTRMFRQAELNGNSLDLELKIEDITEIYRDNFVLNLDRTYSKSEKDMMQAINSAINSITNSSVGKQTKDLNELGSSVVSQLATYFKIMRYDADGDIDLVGAIVYTIFVFQSIMYFFVYLKRFFYIIVLAFFAPFLVLFDFLNKAVGKQSDTLSKWIKEFCALVFVQSIHAFLLTMISSLVMTINQAANSTVSTANAQGLAVINIIALASMSKIEGLVSDMLGMKSTITDTSLKGGAKIGMHGLAGGLATLAGLRRLGDNGKKVIGGVRNVASARKDYKNALAAKNKKLTQFAEITGGNSGAGTGPSMTSGGTIISGGAVPQGAPVGGVSSQAPAASSIPQGTLVGATASNASNLPKGQLVGAAATMQNTYTNSSNNIVNVAGGAAGGATGGVAAVGAVAGGKAGGGQGNSGLTIKDKHRYQDALDNCDAKIAEAKAKRRAAATGLVGGIGETAGSVVGGAAGAVFAGTMHAAAGNFNVQDVVADAIKGAGAGDIIAESIHNTVTGAVDFARDINRGNGKSAIRREIKQKQEIIKQNYKNAGFDVSDLE